MVIKFQYVSQDRGHLQYMNITLLKTQALISNCGFNELFPKINIIFVNFALTTLSSIIKACAL